MGTVTVGHENDTPIELYYEDHGSGSAGRAVAAAGPWTVGRGSPRHHALLGRRPSVISYDRRGFGRSSRSVGRVTTSTPSPLTSTFC